MKKKIDGARVKDYTCDSVIKRGYEIYDEWQSGFSSRRIVNCVERAVAASQEKVAYSSYIEAMACIFALELRIEERYKSLWRCLLFYFSWRREANALKRFKNTLHITASTDIRTAIEIALEALRERIEGEEFDGDDDTRGGKQNGKRADELTRTEKNAQEQATNEKNEEATEAEDSIEDSEEKTEDGLDVASKDAEIKNSIEKQEGLDPSQEALKEVATEAKEVKEVNEAEPPKDEKESKLKKENNGSNEKAETSNDKLKEERAYNDAVDSPPPYMESNAEKSPAVSTLFAEQAAASDAGKENLAQNNAIEDANANNEGPQAQDLTDDKSDREGTVDKNAYLYDKMLLNVKDGVANQSEPKQEQIKNNEKSVVFNTATTEAKVPLQVDVDASIENQIIQEANRSMSNESKEAYYNWQADIVREQLEISNDELAAAPPIEGKKMSEPVQGSKSSATVNKK